MRIRKLWGSIKLIQVLFGQKYIGIAKAPLMDGGTGKWQLIYRFKN